MQFAIHNCVDEGGGKYVSLEELFARGLLEAGADVQKLSWSDVDVLFECCLDPSNIIIVSAVELTTLQRRWKQLSTKHSADALFSTLGAAKAKVIVLSYDEPWATPTLSERGLFLHLKNILSHHKRKPLQGENRLYFPLFPEHYCFGKLMPPPELKYDVVVAGMARPDRLRFRDYLIGALGDLRLKFFMPSTAKEMFSFQEINEAYNQTAIAITFGVIADRHHCITPAWEQDLKMIPGHSTGSSFRVFSQMMAGAFVMADHRDCFWQDFVPDRHLCIFNSFAGVIDHIRYYLGHAEERCKIAEQGHALVAEKYTHKKAGERLIQMVEASQIL